MRLLLPGALLGLLIGYLLADRMNEDYMRILIGLLSLVFGIQQLLGLQSHQAGQHHRGAAGFFGTLAGFTSFSIHAGGPPFTMYLLPKKLHPMIYAGTAGVFFAVVNVTKLLPYASGGVCSTENLLYSLVLVPLAPLCVYIGRYLVKISGPGFYYKDISFFLLVIGVKLLWEGFAGL